jgi:putative ABC transport system permease protein
MFGWTIAPLATVGAAAALLLLMACANVAALLLARATVRGQEIALRMALGAGRGRVIRQLVTESVLLSLVSGVLSLGVAWFSLSALRSIAPLPGVPSIPPLALDVELVAITAFLATITGVACGVVPAFRISGIELAISAGGGHKATASAGQFRLRSALVAVQVAASFVLLVGAVLLATSFVRLAGRDLNYDPDHLVTFDFRIPPLEFARPTGPGRGMPFQIAPFAAATLA